MVVVAAGLGTALSSSPCQYETDYACVVVVADADNASLRSLYLDGVRNAAVDLDDPTVLDIRYIRVFADVVDALPPRTTAHAARRRRRLRVPAVPPGDAATELGPGLRDRRRPGRHRRGRARPGALGAAGRRHRRCPGRRARRRRRLHGPRGRRRIQRPDRALASDDTRVRPRDRPGPQRRRPVRHERHRQRRPRLRPSPARHAARGVRPRDDDRAARRCRHRAVVQLGPAGFPGTAADADGRARRRRRARRSRNRRRSSATPTCSATTSPPSTSSAADTGRQRSARWYGRRRSTQGHGRDRTSR